MATIKSNAAAAFGPCNMPNDADNAAHGHWGENLACEFLMAKGYAILERNWRNRPYEIDIIAMHRGRIVFVEVKAHRNDPLQAITKSKIANMVKCANAYVKMNDIRHEIQFDIIAITGTPANHTLEHLPDAFRPPLKAR